MKATLATLSILAKPTTKEPMMIYLVVSPEAVSKVGVQRNPKQKFVYFISRVLQDTETRYQLVEKVTLALVHASRRLRHYVHSHEIVVKIDCSKNKILQKPKLSGRMIAWSVELFEFTIRYEP